MKALVISDIHGSGYYAEKIKQTIKKRDGFLPPVFYCYLCFGKRIIG